MNPLTHITNWENDESLYSWCGRAHRQLGTTHAQTGVILFGARHAAKNTGIPTRVPHFYRQTRGLLGSIWEILSTRTVLASFLPLLGAEERDRIQALAMGGRPVASSLGMKFGDLHGLRYCVECQRHESQNLGIGTWRLRAQLPGVAICISHARPLNACDNAGARWLLPDAGLGQELGANSAQELEVLLAVARAAEAISTAKKLSVESIRNSAGLALSELYRARDVKRLDIAVVDKDWEKSTLCQWSRRVCPNLACARRDWLSNLLRNRRVGGNPLCLSFLAAYLWMRGLLQTERQLFVDQLAEMQMDLWPMLDIPLSVIEVFRSANGREEAACRLGVSVHTISRWSREHRELAMIRRSWGSSSPRELRPEKAAQ